MLTEVSCPKCSSKLRSSNDLTGKTVRCSKCQERFSASANAVVPAESQGDTQMLSVMDIAAMKPQAKPVVKSALEAIDDLPVLDAMPAAKPVIKAVAKPVEATVAQSTPIPPTANAFAFDEAPPEKSKKRRPAEDDDEDEEEAPKAKKKRSSDEEDTEVEAAAPAPGGAFSFDEEPAPASKRKSKRRMDDEDDDDEKPQRGNTKGKPAKKSGPPVMLLAGLALGFLVLAGGGVAAYFLLNKKSVAKAPTSAAVKPAAATPEPKSTKPETKPTGNTETPDTKPTKAEPVGKGKTPKGKSPPQGPKSNLPKAPAGEIMLASAVKEKFTVDPAPDSIKAFRIVGSGPDQKIFIVRNSFAGFQGQGAIDTVERYAIDSGAKIGSCDVKADGAKWPRPFEPSPDGKYLALEGPAGKVSLFSFEDNKYLLEGVDPFAGKADRKGPLKALNWHGSDTFYVSDANGSTDEWSVAEKKLKKSGTKLPDADADTKVIVQPLDDNGDLLAILRDSQVFILERGELKGPGSLPEMTAVPIALAGSTVADRIKMAVVAQIKDTTQFMVYILNFKDQIAPVAIRLPEGIGPVTGIGWQSVDTLVVTIEGGAAGLLIDLEEQYPVGYVKSPAGKVQVFGKATFNTLWYAIADAAGKTQIGSVNLDFDGYKKMSEDAKGNKTPVYIVPGEKGISK